VSLNTHLLYRLNLIAVRVAFDVTSGRGASSAATTVEVILSVRHSRKLLQLSVIPAAGTAVASSRSTVAHVVDYRVHEYPNQHV